METLPSHILSHMTPTERSLVEEAFAVAQKAHEGQERKSGEPYITHPLRVADTLAGLGLGAEVVAAALLHDVLEESDVTAEDLKKMFGEEVTFLVSSVTKLKDVDFIGEEELAENFRKMVLATAQDIRVVIIKLADVLHNMQTLDALPQERKKRYAREVLEVYAPLAARLGMGELKGELEDLAFKHVHPHEYEELARSMKRFLTESRAYIETLRPQVEGILAEEGVYPLVIDARVKHLYSLWKKLKKYEHDWDKIYDLVALRIIVKNIPDCYATLGALHKQWTPLPGRIKDFIALPKPSGYRSLHTTVFAGEGRITEFQIRTREMHHEAELGIAAHWAYKEQSHRPAGRQAPFKRSTAWIQQLRDWQDAADTQEFLESLRIDFFKDRIFVFTPKGDVIDLPEGATPVDFAYAIHSDLGDRCMLAKVNSKAVQLSTPLKNNDIVEVVTQKNKKPSPDWLTFVKTSKARGKIRESLREQKNT